MTTIYLSNTVPTSKEYVGGTIVETTGKDISGATYVIGLSTSISTPPATYLTPSISTQGATTAERIVKLLIDSSFAIGTYYVWVNISDNPEVLPFMIQGPVVLV